MTSVREALASLREQDDAKRRSFERTFIRTRSRIDRVASQSARRLERIIGELRDEIRARLAVFTGGPGDPFLISIVPRIQSEVQAALGQFTRLASAEVAEQMQAAFDLGGSVTASALQRIGIPLAAPGVTPEILASLVGTTETTFVGLSNLLESRIMREVRLTATALQPASQAIERVERILRARGTIAGVRRRVGLGFQAESIVRTEMGRVYSNAQQIASEKLAQNIPGLKKRWVTSLSRRRGHREVEARYAPDGEIGPILVNRRFEVTEFSRSDFNRQGFWTDRQRNFVYKGKARGRSGSPVTDRMLFPRDPGASAGNSVNCTCFVIEIIPELEAAADRHRGVVQQA